MRHADLRREATAVIARAASALLYDTAVVWYLVWVCGCVGVWLCFMWWDERWVHKTGVNLFRLSFRLADRVEKFKFCDWIPPSENSVEKN